MLIHPGVKLMLMINAEMSSPTMELVPLLCLCLLARSGSVFADGTGSDDPPILLREGDDAILPCSLSTEENIVQKLFDWKKDGQKEVFMYDAGVHYNNRLAGQDEQFEGRVSHFPEQLEFGNASITIRNTKVTDSGNYTCEFPRLQPRQIFHIKLVVGPVLKDRTEENIPGSAPKPYVTIVEEKDEWAQLRCEVIGAYPKPELHWQSSSGNLVKAENPQVTERGLVLLATITKTDNYSCISIQKEIHHQIGSWIIVRLYEHHWKWTAISIIIIVCIVLVVVCCWLVRKKRGESRPVIIREFVLTELMSDTA